MVITIIMDSIKVDRAFIMDNLKDQVIMDNQDLVFIMDIKDLVAIMDIKDQVAIMDIKDIMDRLDINILIIIMVIKVVEGDFILGFVRIIGMFIINSIMKLIIMIQYFWPLKNL